MYKVYVFTMIIELCMTEERKGKKNKITVCFFLIALYGIAELLDLFKQCNSKGFLFLSMQLVSLCLGYHKTAPIPKVQAAIFNFLHRYVESTTTLSDSSKYCKLAK